MANQKISQLSTLTNTTVDVADLIPIVDTSASQTKAITYTNLFSPQDSLFYIVDNSDATKKVQFQVSGVTTATTRTLTVPDADTTIVGTTATQTLTNKTLTAPVVNIGSDATGDMYYRNSGGVLTRLAIGSSDQILAVTGGLPVWTSNPSAANSSYTVKGIVQFLTDAATSGITVSAGVANVNYGTGANQIVKLNSSAQLPALDGSLLTNVPGTNYGVNADETLTTYHTYQIPFAPTSTSVIPGWTSSGGTGITYDGAGSYVRVSDSGGSSYVASTLLIGSGSTSNYSPAQSKTIRIKWLVRLTDTSDTKGWGLCVTAANIYSAQSDTTNGEVRFVWVAGVLYAQNANGTATSTDISTGVTATNWNLYEIVFTPATSIKFYVNGTLKATHTTNLPTTGTSRLAIGASANGRQIDAMPPVISIQL